MAHSSKEARHQAGEYSPKLGETSVRSQLSARTDQQGFGQAMENNPKLQSLAQLQEIANSSPRLRPRTTAQLCPNTRSETAAGDEQTVQRERNEAVPPNHTGLPDHLKSGIENMSGMSLDHVRVHRNSSAPAQLNAHAFAQGSQIHLAPGQDHHLPHEAWHVVQQAQGRVKPTMKGTGGAPINDDPTLEREADVMGDKAHSFQLTARPAIEASARAPSETAISLKKIEASGQAKFSVSSLSSTHALPIQRVEAPDSFEEHVDEQEEISRKISDLHRGDATTLEEIMPGADIWAEETKNAASRKYAEFDSAYRDLVSPADDQEPAGRRVRFGTNTTLEADVEIDGHDEYGGELMDVIEVKRVTGGWDRFTANLLEARRQCAKRTPGYGYGRGIAEIYLTGEFFSNAKRMPRFGGEAQKVYDACVNFVTAGMTTVIQSGPGAQFFVRLYLPTNQYEEFKISSDLYEDGVEGEDFPSR